ncbi:MAG: histidine kinase [Saprospiraceae bacterium]|nr:histidine kinase [Saprospiraceae bacterium]
MWLQLALMRIVVPILIGSILYWQVYILHYFEDMQAGWIGATVMLIPVLIIFEIDRRVTRYFQRQVEHTGGFWQAILVPFLISLLISLLVVFAMYIPGKLWEIKNGARDTIGLFHVVSIGSEVFFMVIIANAIHQLRFLIKKWQEEAIRSANLEKENVQAKLATLTQQISPHFLFNNFNTLYGLIEQHPKGAKEYLMKLSSLYRNVLLKRNEELIPLSEEIDTLRDYIFLIKVRFGSDIQVKINLGEAAATYYIPPMSLQMLVENAIKHNRFDEDHPLLINIEQCGDQLKVENHNSLGTEQQTPSHGIGLENIRNRYQLLADRPIIINQDKYNFSVKIPLLQIVENVA